MHPEFERVAIVNRGEAAMRFINAVREFNQERGTRIRTIALYTDPDRRAMFVREADEAVGLGPATVVDAARRRAEGRPTSTTGGSRRRSRPRRPTRSGRAGASSPSTPASPSSASGSASSSSARRPTRCGG